MGLVKLHLKLLSGSFGKVFAFRYSVENAGICHRKGSLFLPSMILVFLRREHWYFIVACKLDIVVSN